MRSDPRPSRGPAGCPAEPRAPARGSLNCASIIDPTKVERVALQNAASVASLPLTTEALVTDLPEERAAVGPPMPHGDF